ncbi:lysophosphatidic acid receptor 6 [Biomphalaria glabrata]|nr:lysophosphatidic acid receptor 6 [Biomphalaria glabrata]
MLSDGNVSVAQIFGDMLTDNDTQICTFVVYGILSGIVSLFGVFFNVINVSVFFKMGFFETTNITLCSLAVADLIILLMLVAFSVIYNPAFIEAVHGMQVVQALDYLPVGWPFVCFSRISGCLTTYVALERFLCVALPLKVKTILTPGRTVAVNVSVYLVMIGSTLPVFVGFQLGPVYNEDLNLTLVGLLAWPESHELENFSLSFNVFVQLASFFLVVVFTVGLIQSFMRKSEWRKTSSSASNNTSFSSRDKKLVKMITLIAVIFIACAFPGVLGILAMLFVDDYNITGRYKNLFVSTFSVFFALGSINSTVTIFVYFHMSSKFKEVLLDMLQMRKFILKEKRRI